MTLLASLSDDQTAMIGCGLVMLFSIGLLVLSYTFGAGRQTLEKADTVQFQPQDSRTTEESKRRAA